MDSATIISRKEESEQPGRYYRAVSPLERVDYTRLANKVRNSTLCPLQREGTAAVTTIPCGIINGNLPTALVCPRCSLRPDADTSGLSLSMRLWIERIFTWGFKIQILIFQLRMTYKINNIVPLPIRCFGYPRIACQCAPDNVDGLG